MNGKLPAHRVPPLKIAIFCHSLFSCWNHGNAHFLRGVVRELQRAGHRVDVHEPANGWSRTNLIAQAGAGALTDAAAAFPDLSSHLYTVTSPDLDTALDGVDLVIVHEWTEPSLVRDIATRRKRGGHFTLLFHDTHHRAVSQSEAIGQLPLDGFDGVLAFGQSLRELYLQQGWGAHVWSWHEAADTTLFRPISSSGAQFGDLIWVGNWGDGERSQELHEFLLSPARTLRLSGVVHGVRYPDDALRTLGAAGLSYRGWLPNHRVPETFARYRMTIHVPRRPYLEALPGIPTIRVFEALACGQPLIVARWRDVENLFGDGAFLVADSQSDMERHMRAVLNDRDLRHSLIDKGLSAIRDRHSCRHRVEELLQIYATLNSAAKAPRRAVA